jgi:hypothetical protein
MVLLAVRECKTQRRKPFRTVAALLQSAGAVIHFGPSKFSLGRSQLDARVTGPDLEASAAFDTSAAWLLEKCFPWVNFGCAALCEAAL